MHKAEILHRRGYIAGHDKTVRVGDNTAAYTSQKMFDFVEKGIKDKYNETIATKAMTIKDNNLHWIYTPIDSWFNYDHGNEEWASMGMTYDEGRALSAFLYIPNRDALFYTHSGRKSVQKNGHMLYTAKRVPHNDITVSVNGESSGFLSYLIRNLQNNDYDRFSITNSVGTDISNLLLGKTHAYITTCADMYKMLPLIYLCEKAGFIATNAAGEKPLLRDKVIVIGINKTVHASALHAVNTIEVPLL